MTRGMSGDATRKRDDTQAQKVDEDQARKLDDTHDVVIVPRRGGVQRFRVDREKGVYTEPPQEFARSETGGRKARAVIKPSKEFGPALAIAPTRPEPAAQNGTCVLINQHNVRIRNPWTTARLNNEPASSQAAAPDPFQQPLPDRDQRDEFDVLLAGPAGKVYLVRKAAGAAPTITELGNVGVEGEIWYQLRSGFIAGSVHCFQEDKVIPMVNVTSLEPE
jgi:hypothetical protein